MPPRIFSSICIPEASYTINPRSMAHPSTIICMSFMLKQFQCQTIAKLKNNHYLAHEENTKYKLSALCAIIKIQTLFEENTQWCKNYE